MGNQLSSAPSQVLTAEAYIGELPQHSYSRTIRSTRFLKAVETTDDNGVRYVVKAFAKTPELDISGPERIIQTTNRKLASCSHFLPYSEVIVKPTVGFLIRPYIHSNLYDRLTTRPLLSLLEKRWLAFQMLHALGYIHEKERCHGDIKIDNMLLTSWNWLYLCDFADYKPALLPDNNPAAFAFFFDTTSRRTCHLAPERFYTPQENDAGLWREGELTPEMDMFAFGCVLFELLTEGTALFDLAALLKYRKGELDIVPKLAQLEDARLQTLVGQCVALEPSARPSAEQLLESYADVFPKVFLEVHQQMSKFSLRAMSPRSKINLVKLAHHDLVAKEEYTDDDREAVCALLGSLVLASARHVRSLEATLATIDMLDAVSLSVSDEYRLDRLIPYIMYFLRAGTHPLAQVVALRVLFAIIGRVSALRAADIGLFPDYIFPSLVHLLEKEVSEDMVRCVFVGMLPELAARAKDFVTLALTGEQASLYDRELDALRQMFQGYVAQAVCDPCAAVKVAFLTSRLDLMCDFLGPTLKVLLSHMMTFLNGKCAWAVKAAFFKGIVPVTLYVGQHGLEQYIMPLIDKCLTDSEEFVVVSALGALLELHGGMTFKAALKEHFVAAAAPLILHPNPWIVAAAYRLIEALVTSASASVSHCVLLPVIQYPVLALNDIDVLSMAAHPRMPRAVYELIIKSDNPEELLSLLLSPQQQPSARASKLLTEMASAGFSRDHAPSAIQLHGHILRTRTERLRTAEMERSGELKADAMSPYRPRTESASHATRVLRHVAAQRDWSAPVTLTSENLSNSAAKPAPDSHERLNTLTAELSATSGEQPFLIYARDRRGFLHRKQRELHMRGVEPVEARTRHRDSRRPATTALTSWRPSGAKVYHLHEHRAAITSMTVTSDSKHLVTASLDGSIKVWSAQRLTGSAATSVAKASHSTGHEQVLHIEALTHQRDLVAACSRSAVKLLSLEASGAIKELHTWEQPGSTVSTVSKLEMPWLRSELVVAATCEGVVTAWDVRSKRCALRIAQPAAYGAVTSMVADPDGTWVSLLSSRGIVNCFDLRFESSASLFRTSSESCPIGRACLYPEQEGRSPWIVSCIGNTLAVWDMKGKALRNVLRLHTPAPQPTLTTQCAKSRVSPPRTAQEFHAEGIRKQLHKEAVDIAAAWRDLDDIQRAVFYENERQDYAHYRQCLEKDIHTFTASPGTQPARPSVTAVYSANGSPVVFAGTRDSQIVAWDTLRPENTYTLAAKGQGKRTFQRQAGKACAETVELARDDEDGGGVSFGGAQAAPLSHSDSISCLCVLSTAAGFTLVSGDAQGVVKIWQ